MRSVSVTESVAHQLRQAILAGQLQPGQRLVEQKLAAAFGIGQPTVREALKELEHQGFVRKSLKRGTYVTELSAKDLRDMHEVRMALELLAVAKATESMTERAFAELERYLQAMRDAAERLDLAGFHQADMAFHAVIWARSGNAHLAASLERISASLFAFVLLRGSDRPDNYCAAVVQHEGILAGIRTGDPVQAQRAFGEITVTYWEKHRLPGA